MKIVAESFFVNQLPLDVINLLGSCSLGHRSISWCSKTRLAIRQPLDWQITPILLFMFHDGGQFPHHFSIPLALLELLLHILKVRNHSWLLYHSVNQTVILFSNPFNIPLRTEITMEMLLAVLPFRILLRPIVSLNQFCEEPMVLSVNLAVNPIFYFLLVMM